MLLSLEEFKQQKFDQVAAKIMDDPESYLAFESISDFYKSIWLDEFPQGTTWSATGLDDGAEQFYAVIEYGDHYLYISRTECDIITIKMINPSSHPFLFNLFFTFKRE